MTESANHALPPRPILARFSRTAVIVAAVAGLAAAGYATRGWWEPALFRPATPAATDHAEEPAAPAQQILLSDQAQKNLGMTAKRLTAETFWKTISVPGIVADRPGFSDRGVVAPVTGVVSRIHRVAGDAVKPGETLFTMKLLSESLHLTQTDLFKATQDIVLVTEQKKKLAAAAGAVAEAKVIEVDNQLTRLQVGVKAYRQELLTRGISAEQIDAVAQGTFVSEVQVPVPARPASAAGAGEYEVEDLKVELGQQVQAGQTLCLLANHQLLVIEGRAFRDESPLLERAVKEDWPVEVDFAEDRAPDWPPLGQTFRVSYIANTIDPETRTFRFLMPLDNQSRVVEKTGGAQRLWRFRPGQRVRLAVRVEAVENVFVLPAEAVAREGAEAYVFRQNADTFDRKPVQVVYQDRLRVVIANDGSVPAGAFVAQTGATQLNRMIKSQTGTAPKGFHIHADGSVHMGH